MGDFFSKAVDHFIPSRRNVFRPQLLSKPWLIFFATVVLTAEGVLLGNLIARESAFNFLAAVLPSEVITLTNTERAQIRLGGVKESPLLDEAAERKAADMAKKGYFAHVGPDGKEPWEWIDESGYVYRYAGENLAVRFNESSDVVRAWMASPTHRANIVKEHYTEIGVGTAQGMYKGVPATFVVQYFATPVAIAAARTSALEPASATPASAAPAVLGAAVETGAAESSFQSTIKQLLRFSVEPGASVGWILGGIAFLLLATLGLAFFIHIEIQPTHMLLGAGAVALLALFFLGVNTTLLDNYLNPESQGAQVFYSTSVGVLVSEGGTTTAPQQ